jgi:hypothetical protein
MKMKSIVVEPLSLFVFLMVWPLSTPPLYAEKSGKSPRPLLGEKMNLIGPATN